MIKDLISAGDINPDLTTLILTNAIYFKGTWEVQFDVENTTDMTFTTQSAEDIEVPTMCLTGTEDKFNYTENEDMQILELPYSGNEISMMIFLPKEGKDL